MASSQPNPVVQTLCAIGIPAVTALVMVFGAWWARSSYKARKAAREEKARAQLAVPTLPSVDTDNSRAMEAGLMDNGKFENVQIVTGILAVPKPAVLPRESGKGVAQPVMPPTPRLVGKDGGPIPALDLGAPAVVEPNVGKGKKPLGWY
jgi:hypothetical protein